MALCRWDLPFSYDPFYYDPFHLSPRELELFGQNFGMPVFGYSLRQPGRLNRQMKQLLRCAESGVSKIVNDDDKFQVNLDVSHFKPEELNVKVTDDYVHIEGKHEEKQDNHGAISRHFVRKYVLPKNVKVDEIQSSLTDDGVLTVTAPKIPKEALPSNERAIPINAQKPAAVKQ